jgi:D-cysteine desulfhydrase
MLNEPATRDLPLFQAYPRLAEAVPWLPIGNWPTPVTPARHFGAAKGLGAFYLKREDLAHSVCGGNKVRGLEFLLADARRRGAGTILTLGAAGSHHVSRTAWHARQLGMDTVGIVVRQPNAQYLRDNLLRGLEAGVKYVPANYATLAPKLALQFLRPSYWHHRRPPYCLAGGGTSPLSCLGHVNAALELRQQIEAGLLPEPDYLYVALGSLGTAAGLTVGCKLAGLRTRIVGVVVSYRWYCTPGRWARLARRTHRLMRRHDPDLPEMDLAKSELKVVATALGRGYAKFTEDSVRLAQEMKATEGIEFDGTYTAKTLDGALQFIHRHQLHDRVHLFWHTYQPAKPSPASRARLASLPGDLRRYFLEETQPLDAATDVEGPTPAGPTTETESTQTQR